MHGTRWFIVVSILCLCLLANSVGGVAGLFTDSETSTGNSFQAWTSRLWSENTQAEFEAGIIPLQADSRSSPGDVGLARGNRVFAFRGATTGTFWAYGVPGNSWTTMASPPAPNTVDAGGALVYDGSRYIYALRGNTQTAFWRYDTTSNTWAVRSAAPNTVGAGGSLAYDGSRYIYAFRGGGQTTFWRYDTTTDTWATRAPALAAVNTGGSLAYDGSRYVYAFRGGNQTTFWRYDTTTNTWATRAVALARVSAGGSLAYDGSRYIYALRGNNQTTFWRYDTTGNSWTAMTAAPARVGAGGALAYDGYGYIYAFRGNTQNAFWRYDILNNVWAVMANASATVGAGGALAYVRGSTYVTSATAASQVFDTGVAADAWDALIWDETLPSASTDITFEVRASDTLFAANDAVLPWTAVGGTMPIGSGLPAGRYKQWRATLTTSDTSVTPVLHEVRVYYR